MLGKKPVSLFTLVSQHNHDIKFIDTEVSSVFTREVRWTQVHDGYTRSLLWDLVMVTCLPCPSCCSSIASSSQQHSAGIQWKENFLKLLKLSSVEKTQAFGSFGSSVFMFLFEQESVRSQTTFALPAPLPTSPKERLIPVGCKLPKRGLG